MKTLYSIIDSHDGHIIGSYKISAEPEKIDEILEASNLVHGKQRNVAMFLAALISNDIKWEPINISGGLL